MTSQSQLIQKELLQFGQPESDNGGGASASEVQRFSEALKLSDKLTRDIGQALNNGDMLGFRIDRQLKDSTNGQFDTQTRLLNFNSKQLTHQVDIHSLIMTAAHETQHALDRVVDYPQKMKSLLKQQVIQASEIHDYTDEVLQWRADNRYLEARAELNAFNTVVDALQKQYGRTPTLAEIYQEAENDVKNFIQKIEINEEEYVYHWQTHPKRHAVRFQPNADMTLSLDNPNNQEMIASRFYDLGTYPERNAAAVIRAAIGIEQIVGRSGQVHLNMQTLSQYGITLQNLQQQGIDTKQIIDISQPAQSQNNAKEHHIDGLLNKYSAILEAYQSGDMANIQAAQQKMLASSPNMQARLARIENELAEYRQMRQQEKDIYSWQNMPEAAQSLHQQAKAKLEHFYQKNNFAYNEQSLEHSAAALTSMAYAKKLKSIDEIQSENGRLFAIHNNFWGGSDIADMDRKNVFAPLKESFRQILQTEQMLTQEQQERQQRLEHEQSQALGMSR